MEYLTVIKHTEPTALELTDVRNGYIQVPNEDNSKIRLVEICDGLKINCRDYIYKMLLNDTSTMNNFKLNVKRLNRWWYSVYFDEYERR